MEEQRPKGSCPHGEFYLDEGCPQCIAEARRKRESAEAAKPPELRDTADNIVKVRFLNEAYEPIGREYSYFTADPLFLDEFVQVPVGDNRVVKATVTAINVPDSEIAAFRDRVKTIPSGSKRPAPDSFKGVPFGEGVVATSNPPESSDPGKVQARLNLNNDVPEEARGPRRCDVEHIRDYPDCFEDCPKDECDGVPIQEDASKEAAAAQEAITNGQIKFEPEISDGKLVGLAAAAQEAGAQVTEAKVKVVLATDEKEDKPVALATIEDQVGRPTSELFQLYQEAAGLLRIAKTRVIETAEDLKPATNDLAIILTCKKAMYARKTEYVGPLKAKLDLVNKAFAEIIFPVEEADRLTRGQVSAFDNQQRAKAAEAKRIEDEKYKLAQEEAAFNGTGEITVPLGTAQAMPPPERTRTDMGTLGGRDNWKARVINFAALSDEYKLADMQTLNAKARSSKGEAVITGVEFYNERGVTVRTK